MCMCQEAKENLRIVEVKNTRKNVGPRAKQNIKNGIKEN